MKAMSWRLIAVTITASVGYMFTESATFAISIGLADSVIKIFAYYLHERAWIAQAQQNTEFAVNAIPAANAETTPCS